jgi:hypothetical protein
MEQNQTQCIVIRDCRPSQAEALIYFIITVIALYLSFRRNKGFNLGSFLVALIFPYIYIIYYFATYIAGQD